MLMDELGVVGVVVADGMEYGLYMRNVNIEWQALYYVSENTFQSHSMHAQELYPMNSTSHCTHIAVNLIKRTRSRNRQQCRPMKLSNFCLAVTVSKKYIASPTFVRVSLPASSGAAGRQDVE
jgi:hypothetical protein